MTHESCHYFLADPAHWLCCAENLKTETPKSKLYLGLLFLEIMWHCLLE